MNLMKFILARKLQSVQLGKTLHKFLSKLPLWRRVPEIMKTLMHFWDTSLQVRVYASSGVPQTSGVSCGPI